jgi:hypothetical protein
MGLSWGDEAEDLMQGDQCQHERRGYQELASWFGYSWCLDCGTVFPPFGEQS